MSVTLHLRLGDCVEVLKGYADASIGAVVCDPPYEISFMSRGWDGTGIAYDPRLWNHLYRVLVPGGVVKAFSATRTFHRMGAAMRDAGFTELGLEAWGYGCLSEDTEVLTPEGWAHYHSATVGTQVMGFDPLTAEFQWMPVEDTYEYEYDREAFRLVGDNTDHIVSVHHRCVVERDGDWAFVYADRLSNTERVPLVSVQVHPQAQGTEVLQQELCFVRGEWSARMGQVKVERTHYTGKVWCVRVATGAFVARRKGMAFVTGNSGFPKSMNLPLFIDKAAKATGDRGRAIPMASLHLPGRGRYSTEGGGEKLTSNPVAPYVPVTDEARTWEGWGTALKPSWEPVLVGRKAS
jgi:hypothetical protein